MSDADIQLARALVESHPRDAARLLELAPPDAAREIYGELGNELAARLVAAISPTTAARTLAPHPASFVAGVLSPLAPQNATRILRVLEPGLVEPILREMPDQVRARVSQLLTFTSDQIGSRMDPRTPTVGPATLVDDALNLVRNAAEGALQYVYVLDDENRLIGVVSMRELMCAAPEVSVGALMTDRPERVFSDDSISTLLSHPGWDKTHALPVVDREGVFLGTIRYSTYRALSRESGRDATTPAQEATTEALADIFRVGSSAVGRLAGSLLIGSRGSVREGGQR